MITMNKTRLSGVVGVLILVTCLFGGCARRGVRVDVPVQGVRLPSEYGTAIDVSNWRGSVYVVADPRVKEPVVRALVRPVGKGAPKRSMLSDAVKVTANSSINGAERLLKVRSVAATEPAAPVQVELYIRVAKADGLTIRNAGGPVELVRVGGAIDVENGFGGQAGGDVQVRTGDAMTKSSTLVTSSGKVLYQVGPGSTGAFNLMADKGEVQFNSRLGEVTGVVPEETRWRGVLNGGQNQITLHSGDGLVRVHVIENAGTYGPETWDGYPKWPSKPRFIGRLGGHYNDEPLFTGGRQAPAK